MSGDGSAVATDWFVVRPEGEIDLYSAPGLRGTLLKGLAAGRHKILLDLDAVTFMDSSGFAVLVSAYKRVKALGGELRIAGANSAVRSSLRISGLDRVLELYPDAATALAPVDPSAGGQA